MLVVSIPILDKQILYLIKQFLKVQYIFQILNKAPNVWSFVLKFYIAINYMHYKI